MRFCSLKTYLSACCQLMFFHPTVFSESVLGIFATTCTSIPSHTASYVCLSRQLRHLFFSIARWFELGICFLTHPSLSLLVADTYLFSGAYGRVTSFLISIVESFRVCLSTGVLGCALTRSGEPVRPYPCRLFPFQGVDRRLQAYIPGGLLTMAQRQLVFSTPRLSLSSACGSVFWNLMPLATKMARL